MTTNNGPLISKSARVRPALAKPALERGERDLAHVALGRERVEDHAVGHLAGDLGHELADGREPHLGQAVRVRAGLKNGVISVCV